MKVKFTNNERWSSVRLHPETVEEVAALVRTASNAKREPLRMTVSFGEDGSITAYIQIAKREPKNQTNFISNGN